MARLAFLGTPDAAVPPLRALSDAGHDIVIVVTQPDRRRGRGGALVPSPVKAAALDLGLSVTDKVDDVIGSGAELGVVVAFGRLIRPHVLEAMPMVNLHFSLLPRWRGAAPVERAILAGDPETGVCLMALEEGLDTGPVYEAARVEIGGDETADELRARLVAIGTEMLVRRLAGGVAGLGIPQDQEGEPTYAAKIDPAELEIDWASPADFVHRLVRLGTARTAFRGRQLNILRARQVEGHDLGDGAARTDGGPVTAEPGTLVRRGSAVQVVTGRGLVELLEVKPEGKGAMPAAAWFNGAHPSPDEHLGR